jgi:galactose mutarotase-like enzyme
VSTAHRNGSIRLKSHSAQCVRKSVRYACNMKNLELTRIALTDADNRVSIAPGRGALVTSFIANGRERLYLDESTFNDLSKNVRGGVPVLFPTPGKLADDRWSYAGQQGTMKQHGFARLETWSVVSQSANTLICALDSNERTLAQYPWPFAAEIEFALRGTCLRITFRLKNTGATVMPFGIGYHPYFYVADKTRASLPTDATRAFDNRRKATEPFNGFDFTQDELDLHLFDHSAQQCTLITGESDITLRASKHHSLWVIWTLAGKDFICVEPWTSPGNALNTGERLLTLSPGEQHESWIEIEAMG